MPLTNPTVASAIKSIQRGTLSTTTFPQTVTISAVNTNKTEIDLVGYMNNADASVRIYARLTSSTQITVTAVAGSLVTGELAWQAVEYV
jgi:hypothetical protein